MLVTYFSICLVDFKSQSQWKVIQVLGWSVCDALGSDYAGVNWAEVSTVMKVDIVIQVMAYFLIIILLHHLLYHSSVCQ